MIKWADILGNGVLEETYKSVPTKTMSESEITMLKASLGIDQLKLQHCKSCQDGSHAVKVSIW